MSFGTELLLLVLYSHRPDSGVCGCVIPVERQDWTAPAGLSSGREVVLVGFGPVVYQKSRQTSVPLCSLAVALREEISCVQKDMHNCFPDFFPSSF